MLKLSLLAFLLSAVISPVLGVLGPDPVPATVLNCTAPFAPATADLNIGAFLKPNQQLIAENQTWINGPNNKYTVSYCQVTGSSQQFYSLANGPYDAILTTFDNLVNRQLNGLGQFVVLLALDNTPGQVILGNGDFKSIADLKGKNIATDSSTSGYVLQFRAVAADNGLFYERGDYNFVAIGGTPSRYAALRNGSTAAGIQVDATVVGPPQSITYTTDSSVRGLNFIAAIDDYVAPLTDIVLAVEPKFFNNPRKVGAIIEYIEALIKGQAILTQPANRAYVESVFQSSEGFTATQAAISYQQLLSPLDGTVTTVPLNLTLGRLDNLNVAYLRQRFGGFNNPYQNFTSLISYGPGQFIDYTNLTSALAVADATIAVHATQPAAICVYPAIGQSFIVSKATASVAAGVSGGCSGAPTVSFVSCTSTDTTASASQCYYDATHDALRLVAATSSISASRVYTATYSASDICGASVLIAQTTTVQPLTAINHYGCNLV